MTTTKHKTKVAKTGKQIKLSAKKQLGGLKKKSEGRLMKIFLDCNRTYAHTSTCLYRIVRAELQTESVRPPKCRCNIIESEKRRSKVSNDDHTVMVAVEHDLEESIICVLNAKNEPQCKVELTIEPGEQISFKCIGKIPVVLYGVRLNDN